MPCSDWGRASSYEDTTKVDRLTRLLCSACKSLERNKNHTVFKEVPALRTWWEQHKEVDRQREASEERERTRKRKKKQALEKLTQEERKLLGLL